MSIFNILTSPVSKFLYLFLFQLSNCKFFLLENEDLRTYLAWQKLFVNGPSNLLFTTRRV